MRRLEPPARDFSPRLSLQQSFLKPYTFIVLFLLVLAAPFALRAVLTTGAASSTSGASARLVVITPHNQDIRREFARAFSEWHLKKYGQAVSIDYRTQGATNDIKRQLADTYNLYRDKAGNLFPPEQVHVDLDVVWGGGDYFFDQELKRLFRNHAEQPVSVLQPMHLDPALLNDAFPQPRLAGVKLYDLEKDAADNPAPQWVGVCLSSFGIVYNAELYARLGLAEPRMWSDLTNPKLNGLVALADPTRSGSAGVAYQMVVQRAMADAEEIYLKGLPRGADGKPPPIDKKDPAYQAAIANGWHNGMGQLTLIAANARYFTDSAPLVPSDVGDGQAAAGMAIDFYGRVYQESVGPRRCRFVSPVAATAITPDPVAILYGVQGKQLELAMHFVEFLLTRRAQELWITRPGFPDGPAQRALRREPIRADLYGPGADRSHWSDPEVNPFAEAGSFNQRGEWMALYTDTRPIWAAAWIDAREPLKAAYDAVLAVSDDARRAELLRELADVPLKMQDVRQQMEQRLSVERGGGDLDEWQARRRMDWARTFAAHYNRVRQQASGL